MKLEQVKSLNENNFDHDGEMDLHIQNVQGHPYSMYVNETSPISPNGITFQIASDDDDGLIFEVDLGAPQGRSVGYEAPSDHGPGGHEVEWSRDTSEQSEVTVRGETTNNLLNNLSPHITSKLSEMAESGSLEGDAGEFFSKVLTHINNQQA